MTLPNFSGSDDAARACVGTKRARHGRSSCASPRSASSGATLGGSNRTPLAIACALRLATRRSSRRARRPRVRCAIRRTSRAACRVDDDARLVGDEAIECARAGVTVFVARSRQHAIDAAELEADVLVLDGPLQLEPGATLVGPRGRSRSRRGEATHARRSATFAHQRALLESAADAIVRGRARHAAFTWPVSSSACERARVQAHRPHDRHRASRACALVFSGQRRGADVRSLQLQTMRRFASTIATVDLWLTTRKTTRARDARLPRKCGASSTTTWTYLTPLQICCFRASPVRF